MTFELSAIPESRVCHWLEKVTERAESSFEFGAGLFTYTKASKARVKSGVEAFRPYIDAVIEGGNYTDIGICHGDMRDYAEWIMPGDYEVALFIDSLEHVPKEDGLEMLQSCQAKFKRIAIFVPEGWHDNPACDGNDMQLHKSSWDRSDLESLGFIVDVDANFHFNNPPEKRAAMFAVWNK